MFELECRALRKVRNEMGLTNVQVMIPFVRTLNEARSVTELLAKNGLARGQNGLKVIMMCELPTNALLADKYLEYFDGMSIGSNDMTQLTLGLDRDSAIVAKLFDERDEAVKMLLAMAITACKKQGKYVGICGQGLRITRTLPCGCSSRASRACRSTRIRWSRPGCSSQVKAAEDDKRNAREPAPAPGKARGPTASGARRGAPPTLLAARRLRASSMRYGRAYCCANRFAR